MKNQLLMIGLLLLSSCQKSEDYICCVNPFGGLEKAPALYVLDSGGKELLALDHPLDLWNYGRPQIYLHTSEDKDPKWLPSTIRNVEDWGYIIDIARSWRPKTTESGESYLTYVVQWGSNDLLPKDTIIFHRDPKQNFEFIVNGITVLPEYSLGFNIEGNKTNYFVRPFPPGYQPIITYSKKTN